MPLSAPVARNPIHTRQVICRGFRRLDGLWDIEGLLIDTKDYDFQRLFRPDTLKAGEALHKMSVRITVDNDLLIHAVEAVTDDSPFPHCGDITPAFSALKGLNLGQGFLKEVRTRFSGVNGCTHIVEMMGPIATTAFQTIFPVLSREREQIGRPPIIDSCHAFAADGSVVAHLWPQYATGSNKAGQSEQQTVSTRGEEK